MSGVGNRIRVLCVDDDPEFVETTVLMLSNENESITAFGETDPTTVLDRIEDEETDCVVCDYNMPDLDGLEVLEAVRNEHDDLPFILFTGRGSEEIASRAISEGVTDYLQKSTGVEQFTVLANRITNAVSQYRAQLTIQDLSEFQKLVEHATDVISIVDPNGKFSFVTPSSRHVLGYDPDEMVGRVGFEFVHPDDRMDAIEVFAESVENPGEIYANEFRFDHPDGWIWLESRSRNMVDDPDIGGLVIYSRDITELKEQQRENERLEQFASVVSHDLRNPLSVAGSRLELLRMTEDFSHTDNIEQALNRMEQIIGDLLDLARAGRDIGEVEPVEFEDIVAEAWENVDRNGVDLSYTCDHHIYADRHRLVQLLENLYRNAIDHNAEDVEIRVDVTEDGFYVEDDGEGIPEDVREEIFETGYTTSDDGTGFGLAIVQEISQAHGWSITVADGQDGGARIQFSNVNVAEA